MSAELKQEQKWKKNVYKNRAWWCTPVTLTFQNRGQKNFCEFDLSLGYTISPRPAVLYKTLSPKPKSVKTKNKKEERIALEHQHTCLLDNIEKKKHVRIELITEWLSGRACTVSCFEV